MTVHEESTTAASEARRQKHTRFERDVDAQCDEPVPGGCGRVLGTHEVQPSGVSDGESALMRLNQSAHVPRLEFDRRSSRRPAARMRRPDMSAIWRWLT
jgi:hypothetical protein